MREVVFVDFARTAFVSRGGSLRSFSACALGAACLKGLAEKSGISLSQVDAVFAGAALKNKDTCAPVRYMTQLAGFPVDTEGHQVEMQDGSALAAINHAAFQIALGYADVAMAGGMESHSTQPVYMSSVTQPYMGFAPQWLQLQFTPEGDPTPEEISANLAARYSIDETQCSAYAQRSRDRLAAALESGLVGDEILPITTPGTKKAPGVTIDKDELPQNANVPAACDGAAFVLMMSAEKAKELGYAPYARWVMGADIGAKPENMGTASAFSDLKALQLANLTAADMDVWECGELSAAQQLAVIRELEQAGTPIDQDKWNPCGGAIAMGHPNAASGARMAMFAMKQLEKTGGRYGIISTGCQGGHGVSVIIENVRR